MTGKLQIGGEVHAAAALGHRTEASYGDVTMPSGPMERVGGVPLTTSKTAQHTNGVTNGPVRRKFRSAVSCM